MKGDNFMSKFKKFAYVAGISASAVTICHFINKTITKNATDKHLTDNPDTLYYEWKFGKIAYTEEGNGSPLLLIHNISSEFSSYEWKRITKSLSKKHTVYTLDLLGCGHSDKPNITYTTYMYTQLINDFVLNVIKKRTDVVASNDSSTLVLMSAMNNPLAYDNIILINPQSIQCAGKGSDYRDIYRKHLLDIPVIGTLIYNMCHSKKYIFNDFVSKNFYNKKFINNDWLDGFYETSHIGGVEAKYLFSSVSCGYTAACISRALSLLHKITIITGKSNPCANDVCNEYTDINPDISTYSIVNSKLMPQMEQPLELFRIIEKVLNN